MLLLKLSKCPNAKRQFLWPTERAPYGRVPHRRVKACTSSVGFIGVYLAGVHLIGMYLMIVHLAGVYLMGVYFMGVHLISQSHRRNLTGVQFFDLQNFWKVLKRPCVSPSTEPVSRTY
jgi:hypothetical protein